MMPGARPGAGLRLALEDPEGADALFLERVAIPVGDRLWLVACAGAMGNGLAGEIAAATRFDGATVVDILARAAGLGFVTVMIVALILRRQPLARAPGPLPRLAAIGGAFSITGFGLLPKVEMLPEVAFVSLALVIVGYGLAVYAVMHLGRSLSIMAEARQQVTSRPYGIVRHPLYASETIASLGLLLQYLSLPAVILWCAHVALQCCRLGYEEKLLREALPGYACYAGRVRRLVPGLQ